MRVRGIESKTILRKFPPHSNNDKVGADSWYLVRLPKSTNIFGAQNLKRKKLCPVATSGAFLYSFNLAGRESIRERSGAAAGSWRTRLEALAKRAAVLPCRVHRTGPMAESVVSMATEMLRRGGQGPIRTGPVRPVRAGRGPHTGTSHHPSRLRARTQNQK